MKITYGFILVAILITVSWLPVFGQTSSESSVTLTTDKSSYSDGDQIIITGTVNTQLNVPISIIIKDPSQNIVMIGQTTVNPDETYSTQAIAGGRLWTTAGIYEIDVTYGNKNNTAKATFEFTGQVPVFPIVIKGQSYNATYSITNGKITDIIPNTNTKSLEIKIQPSGNGTLSITLPRSLIDAKNGNQDGQFMVQKDGDTITFNETKSDVSRTLTISFSQNTNQITVIGTQIIPEFGSATLMVLATIIGSVIFYMRSKQILKFVK